MKKIICFLLFVILIICFSSCSKSIEIEEVEEEKVNIEEKIISNEVIPKGESIKVPILLFHHFSESSNDSSVIKVSNFELHIKTTGWITLGISPGR